MEYYGAQAESIALTPRQRAYATHIGKQREAMARSRPLDSGYSDGDVIGAMAEIAVCLYFDVSYLRFVTVYDERPGAIPDLCLGDYTVSVKGRTRNTLPLDLIVPAHDTHNDMYILVSVNYGTLVESGVCRLWGYIRRNDLLQYPVEEWKWTTDRPGAKREATRRYIPVQKLTPVNVLLSEITP